MIAFPNAKLNLGLYIGDTLPNGYHEIVTAMVPIGWTDILEAVPAAHSSLEVSGNRIDCPEERNIVMRALRLMQQRASVGEMRMLLHKIVPDGAGMGGGSADGAFALKMLNETAPCPLPPGQLREAAAALGSDCPFFIDNRPAMATGTGTTLSPLRLPSLQGCRALVAKPRRSVSTAEAYAEVRPSHIGEQQLRATLALPVEQWRGHLHNDFEASVEKRLPEVARIKERLYAAGALYAAMTGSGSAVFGIFRSDKMADPATLGPEVDHAKVVDFIGI